MAEKFSTGFVNAEAAAIRTALANGVIGIYSGTQPATANDTEGAAVLLMRITLNGGAFTPGSATNGINFDAPVDGVLSKAAAETWSGTGLADGTATWFRFYSNAMTTGASTTAVRYDGAITTLSTAELQMTNTTVVTGVPGTVNSFSLTMKKSA